MTEMQADKVEIQHVTISTQNDSSIAILPPIDQFKKAIRLSTASVRLLEESDVFCQGAPPKAVF